jgi:hypothetical protein
MPDKAPSAPATAATVPATPLDLVRTLPAAVCLAGPNATTQSFTKPSPGRRSLAAPAFLLTHAFLI